VTIHAVFQKTGIMKRRGLLKGALAGFALAQLPACRFSFEQGLSNPCLSPLPRGVAGHPLVKSAWQGIEADAVWDCHVHLFGNGRSGSGIWVNPEFDHPKTVASKVRHFMFANGGCLGDDEARWDERMVDHLAQQVDELPQGVKVMLLAFDFAHDPDGSRRDDLTTFSVPNGYAAKVAKSRPDRFEWIASVHPYRKDAIAALDWCKANGARAVKWLPPSMGIDLASVQCIPFYQALKRLNLALLTHVGEEQSVEGAQREDFGHPLALRHPLDHGVPVIAAHCASLGESPDWDAAGDRAKAPQAENFMLFSRLMAEPRYESLLFGDISALTQLNRAASIATIIGNDAWRKRLLNGSDYPLPGIMPLFSLDHFVKRGLLEEAHVPILREIRKYNALLFDFVLKRSLRAGNAGFPAGVFETRKFFLD
jgi:predicted TIM-barrel fold metal-dependent hydrolase